MTELRSESKEEQPSLRDEFDLLRADIVAMSADLKKWMFIFWLATVLPLAALMIALTR